MSEEKKNEILEEKVNTEELEAVNGGWDIAEGKGGCKKCYYREGCTATVEEGSHCWKNDYCALIKEGYHRLRGLNEERIPDE